MPADTFARPGIHIAPAQTAAEWAAARSLLAEMITWLADAVTLDVRAHQHDSNEELDGLESFYSLPDGQLLLGSLGGRPAGTTGVRRLDAETAELRRVWVTPVARGNALAPALVQAGIDAARGMGARRLWLETARGSMDKAISIYTAFGFREIPAYSSLPENFPQVITLGLELD